MRENACLRGYQRRDGNETLSKIDKERRLEERFGIKLPRHPVGPQTVAFKMSLGVSGLRDRRRINQEENQEETRNCSVRAGRIPLLQRK